MHVLVSRFVSATRQILVSRNASVHEQQYMFIIVAMVLWFQYLKKKENYGETFNWIQW